MCSISKNKHTQEPHLLPWPQVPVWAACTLTAELPHPHPSEPCRFVDVDARDLSIPPWLLDAGLGSRWLWSVLSVVLYPHTPTHPSAQPSRVQKLRVCLFSLSARPVCRVKGQNRTALPGNRAAAAGKDTHASLERRNLQRNFPAPCLCSSVALETPRGVSQPL